MICVQFDWLRDFIKGCHSFFDWPVFPVRYDWLIDFVRCWHSLFDWPMCFLCDVIGWQVLLAIFIVFDLPLSFVRWLADRLAGFVSCFYSVFACEFLFSVLCDWLIDFVILFLIGQCVSCIMWLGDWFVNVLFWLWPVCLSCMMRLTDRFCHSLLDWPVFV